MQKVNILYVITKLELGGAQKQLLSLITHLDKERYNTFLFTACDGLLVEEATSIKALTLRKSRCLERPINPLKDFIALTEIYRYIKKNNIDIVHTHSSKAGALGRFAARLAKVKFIIHTVHGWSFNDYQPKILRWWFISLERLTAQFTHKLIVVSYYDKQTGLQNRIGREDKYKLIRYGIDYTEFIKADQDINPVRNTDFPEGRNKISNRVKEELGINSTDLVVGMISCFKPQKAPQDFIRLAYLVNQTMQNVNPVRNTTQLNGNIIVSNGVNPVRNTDFPEGRNKISNGVKFLLVGDGILRNQIKKLINNFKLQDKIILTGWRRDIRRILSAIDIFVLTSLWEGLPIAALEALVSSKPVVATNTGGIQEIIIEGKNGFLIKPRHIKKLSERLIALLRSENLRKDMGESAKSLSDFSLESMVRNNQDLYDRLIRKGGEGVS